MTLPYLHCPHDSGPIQWARGDLRRRAPRGSIIKTAPSHKNGTSCRIEKRSKDPPPFADAACGGLKNTTSHENRVCIFCETKHKQKDPRGRVAVHGCIIIDAIIHANLHCGRVVRTRCKRSAVARVCLLYLCRAYADQICTGLC